MDFTSMIIEPIDDSSVRLQAVGTISGVDFSAEMAPAAVEVVYNNQVMGTTKTDKLVVEGGKKNPIALNAALQITDFNTFSKFAAAASEEGGMELSMRAK